MGAAWGARGGLVEGGTVTLRFLCMLGHHTPYTGEKPKRCPVCGAGKYVDLNASTRKGYLPDPGSKWIPMAISPKGKK